MSTYFDKLFESLGSFYGRLSSEDRAFLKDLWEAYSRSADDLFGRLAQIDAAKSVAEIAPSVARGWYKLDLSRAQAAPSSASQYRIEREVDRIPLLQDGITRAPEEMVQLSPGVDFILNAHLLELVATDHTGLIGLPGAASTWNPEYKALMAATVGFTKIGGVDLNLTRHEEALFWHPGVLSPGVVPVVEVTLPAPTPTRPTHARLFLNGLPVSEDIASLPVGDFTARALAGTGQEAPVSTGPSLERPIGTVASLGRMRARTGPDGRIYFVAGKTGDLPGLYRLDPVAHDIEALFDPNTTQPLPSEVSTRAVLDFSSTGAHPLAYDAARRRVVMLRAQVGATVSLHEWSGTLWLPLTATGAPVQRIDPAAVYDRIRAQLVVFGGLTGIGDPGVTYGYSAAGWSVLAGSGVAHPPSTMGSTAVYVDRADTGHMLVLDGLVLSGTQPGGLWKWDGAAWTLLDQGAGAHPEKRYRASMAYDAAQNKVVLVGGVGAETSDYLTCKTWAWNGTVWASTNPPAELLPRYGAALAYDPLRQRVLLFGGRIGDVASNTFEDGSDFWSWNGATSTWTRLVVNGVQPPALSEPRMAWDEERNRMVLIGASPDGIERVWEWDGERWTSASAVAGERVDPTFFAITDSAFDRAGRLWAIGGQQVYRREPDGTQTVVFSFKTLPGYETFMPRALAIDAFDRVFFATVDGVYQTTLGELYTQRPAPALVLALASGASLPILSVDQTGGVWAAAGDTASHFGHAQLYRIEPNPPTLATKLLPPIGEELFDFELTETELYVTTGVWPDYGRAWRIPLAKLGEGVRPDAPGVGTPIAGFVVTGTEAPPPPEFLEGTSAVAFRVLPTAIALCATGETVIFDARSFRVLSIAGAVAKARFNVRLPADLLLDGSFITFTSAKGRLAASKLLPLADVYTKPTSVAYASTAPPSPTHLDDLIKGADYVQEAHGLRLYSKRAQDRFAGLPEADGTLDSACLWAPTVFLDEDLVFRNFGHLAGLPKDLSIQDLTTYTRIIKGLWYVHWNGPTPENLRDGLAILFGYPTAPVAGVVRGAYEIVNGTRKDLVAGQPYPTTNTFVEVVDAAGTVHTVEIPAPFRPVLATGRSGERTLAVSSGTAPISVRQYQSLSDAVRVVDAVNSPQWWRGVLGLARYAAGLDATALSAHDASRIEELLGLFNYAIYLKAFQEDTRLVITTKTLPDARLGLSYVYQLSATGGAPSYSWSLDPATPLPPGITLSSTGVLSGIPMSLGVTGFRVFVTDTELSVAEANLTLVVDSPLVILTLSLEAGQLGGAYADSIQTMGGTLPLTFSVTSRGFPPGLALNPFTGIIDGVPLVPGDHTFTVVVADSSIDPQLASREYTLSVREVGLPPPLRITTPTVLTLARTSTAYAETFTASGGQLGATLVWSISAPQPNGLEAPLVSEFAMSSSGVLTGASPTVRKIYTFQVEVRDGALSASTTQRAVRTHILEVVAPSERGAPVLLPDRLPSAVVGRAYSVPLLVRAGTGLPPFQFALTGDALPAGLSFMAGGVSAQITGRPLGPPDAGNPPRRLLLTVTDSQSPARTTSKSYTLPVVRLTDLVILTSSPLTSTEGVAIGFLQLLASGGIPPYEWSFNGNLPPGVNTPPAEHWDGTFTGTPTQAGSFPLLVAVRDQGNPDLPAQIKSKQLIWEIEEGAVALRIVTAALPNGVAGLDYAQANGPRAIFEAEGGVAPYVWSIVSGSLPTGLTLGANGHLTGAALTPVVASFRVRVTDQDAAFTEANFSLTILTDQNCSTPLAVDTSALPNATLGQFYEAFLIARGCAPPYRWTATGLPSGLTLNNSTGRVSGTPQRTGTFSLAVTVTDFGNTSANGTVSLVVGSGTPIPPLAIETTALPPARKDTSYRGALVASGGLPWVDSDGVERYRWQFFDGTLPEGLSVLMDGTVFGTPTAAGDASFRVQVEDSRSVRVVGRITLHIGTDAIALAIDTAALSAGTVGLVYSTALNARGGAQPYTWDLAAGALPAGLALSSEGILHGTPTAATDADGVDLTLRVTDGAGTIVTRVLALIVNAPLSNDPIILTTVLAAGRVGTSYADTLQGARGTAPYTWAIVAGALPAGLVLTAGRIAGTPTATPGTTFTVQLTDATSPTPIVVTKVLSIVIGTSPVALAVLPQTFEGREGVLFPPAMLHAAGGALPYTWTLAAGAALPPGLALLDDGTLTGVPLTEGRFSVGITVTDNVAATASGTASFIILGAIRTPLSILTTALPDGAFDTPYTAALAGQGGAPPYTWALEQSTAALGPSRLPSGTTLFSGGVVSGTPETPGGFIFGVRLTDAKGATTTADITWTVDDGVEPPVVILSTQADLDATTHPVGADFAFAFRYNDHVVRRSPVLWAVIGGALPPGLALSERGMLAGTPAAQGVFHFVVRATAAAPSNSSDNRAFELRIDEILDPPLVVLTDVLPSAVVGKAYNAYIAATGGESTTYRWTLNGLPPGTIPGTALVWSIVARASAPAGLSGQGVFVHITGVATATAELNLVAVVEDLGTHPRPQRAQKTFALRIVELQPLRILKPPPDLAPGRVTRDYKDTIIATGGVAPYKWGRTDVVDHGLEIAFSLSHSETGLVMGVPTGTGVDPVTRVLRFNILLEDSDSPPSKLPAGYDIVIGANIDPLGIVTSSPLIPAYHEQVYTAGLQAVGGLAPYTWRLVGGTLPPGLQLSSDGEINSNNAKLTELAPLGVYRFDVEARDTDPAGPNTARKTFQLSVFNFAVAPVISAETDQTWFKGIAGTSIVRVDGGTAFTLPDRAAYKLDILEGALPPGLELQDPGRGGNVWTVVGTPTAAGLFKAIYRAMDGDGVLSAPATVNYLVKDDILEFDLVDGEPPAGAVGEGYGQRIPPPGGPKDRWSIAVKGGLAPFTWSLPASVLGFLPPGLRLDSSGRLAWIIGTPAQGSAGIYVVTLQVKDSRDKTAVRRLELHIADDKLTLDGASIQIRKDVEFRYSLIPHGGRRIEPPYYRFPDANPGTGVIDPVSGSFPTGIILRALPGDTTGAAEFFGTVGGGVAAGATFQAVVAVEDFTPGTPQRATATFDFTIVATGVDAPLEWANATNTPPSSLPPGHVGERYTFALDSLVTGGNVDKNGALVRNWRVPIPWEPDTPETDFEPERPKNSLVSRRGGQIVALVRDGTWYAKLEVNDAVSADRSATGQPIAATGSLTASQVSLLIDSALRIVTTGLPDGARGISYPLVKIVAAGGKPPYVFWTMPLGQLPDGIVFQNQSTLPASRLSEITDERGQLGCGIETPGAASVDPGAEDETFEIQVQDAVGAKDKKQFVLRIQDPDACIGPQGARILFDTPSPLPTGRIGVDYGPKNLQIKVHFADNQPHTERLPFTFVVLGGALPKGLTLETTTGRITGAPQESGDFTCAIQARDAGVPIREACSRTYTMHMEKGPGDLELAPAVFPDGRVTVAYELELTASGANPSFVLALNEGALPGGLALTQKTGVANGTKWIISGTPTVAGTFPFKLKLSDSVTPTANFILAARSIRILPRTPIQIVSPTFDNAPFVGYKNVHAGTPYSFEVAATGGTPPLTWTVLADRAGTGGEALPAGLVLAERANERTTTVTGTVADADAKVIACVVEPFHVGLGVADSSSPESERDSDITDMYVVPTERTGVPRWFVDRANTTGLGGGNLGTAYSVFVYLYGKKPLTLAVPQILGVTVGVEDLIEIAPNVWRAPLAGTPAQAGTFNVTIDFDACSVPLGTVKISSTLPPEILCVGTLPDGFTNERYGPEDIATASGGTPHPSGAAYDWAIDPSIPGLTLTVAADGLSAALVGQVADARKYVFEVIVTDHDGRVLRCTNSLRFRRRSDFPYCGATVDDEIRVVTGQRYRLTFYPPLSLTTPITWGLPSPLPSGMVDVTAANGNIAGEVTGTAGAESTQAFEFTAAGGAPPLELLGSFVLKWLAGGAGGTRKPIILMTRNGTAAWEYDIVANTWTSRAITGAAGDFAQSAYDAARKQLVICARGATYKWDGTAVTNQNLPTLVGFFSFFTSMAFDSVRNVVVFFGHTADDAPNQTWEYDGTSWTQRNPVTVPPVREWAAMAYDPVRQKTVLFGGTASAAAANTVCRNDTWEWNGSNWVQVVTAAAPSARGGAVMVYDAARAKMLLFGGAEHAYDSAPGDYKSDTWEYDGVNWTLKSPATVPGVRAGAAMTYDATSQKVVMLGGGDSGQPKTDTWIWDGVNWAAGLGMPYGGWYAASFQSQGHLFVHEETVPSVALNIETHCLPDGLVGRAYRFALHALGGSQAGAGEPYTWALTAGALPAGLALSAGGIITGTPTLPGTFPLTVRATDSVAGTDTQVLTLVIHPSGDMNWANVVDDLPDAVVCTDYPEQTGWNVIGGQPPYFIESPARLAFPIAGLTLELTGDNTNAPGGKVRGKAREVKDRQIFVVTITDSSTPPKTLTHTTGIRSIKKALTIESPRDGQGFTAIVGQAFGFQVQTNDDPGGTPLRWRSSPSGIDASSGYFSSTFSAAGTVTITVTVESVDCPDVYSATATYTVTVSSGGGGSDTEPDPETEPALPVIEEPPDTPACPNCQAANEVGVKSGDTLHLNDPAELNTASLDGAARALSRGVLEARFEVSAPPGAMGLNYNPFFPGGKTAPVGPVAIAYSVTDKPITIQEHGTGVVAVATQRLSGKYDQIFNVIYTLVKGCPNTNPISLPANLKLIRQSDNKVLAQTSTRLTLPPKSQTTGAEVWFRKPSASDPAYPAVIDLATVTLPARIQIYGNLGDRTNNQVAVRDGSGRILRFALSPDDQTFHTVTEPFPPDKRYLYAALAARGFKGLNGLIGEETARPLAPGSVGNAVWKPTGMSEQEAYNRGARNYVFPAINVVRTAPNFYENQPTTPAAPPNDNPSDNLFVQSRGLFSPMDVEPMERDFTEPVDAIQALPLAKFLLLGAAGQFLELTRPIFAQYGIVVEAKATPQVELVRVDDVSVLELAPTPEGPANPVSVDLTLTVEAAATLVSNNPNSLLTPGQAIDPAGAYATHAAYVADGTPPAHWLLDADAWGVYEALVKRLLSFTYNSTDYVNIDPTVPGAGTTAFESLTAAAIQDTVAPEILVSPAPGVYNAPFYLLAKPNEWAVLLYSFGAVPPGFVGTSLTPDGNARRYWGPVRVDRGVTQVNLIARDAAGNTSSRTVTYQVLPEIPKTHVTPSPGVYTAADGAEIAILRESARVVFYNSDPGVRLWYTTDGKPPTDIAFPDAARLNGLTLVPHAFLSFKVSDYLGSVDFLAGRATGSAEGDAIYAFLGRPNLRYFIYAETTKETRWKLVFGLETGTPAPLPNTERRLLVGYIVTDGDGYFDAEGLVSAAAVSAPQELAKTAGLTLRGDFTPVALNALAPIEIPNTAEKTLRYFVKTPGGRFEPTTSLVYRFDTIAPHSSVTGRVVQRTGLTGETSAVLRLDFTAEAGATVFWSAETRTPTSTLFGFPDRLVDGTKKLEIEQNPGNVNAIRAKTPDMVVVFEQLDAEGNVLPVRTLVDAGQRLYVDIPAEPYAFFDITVIPDFQQSGKWRLKVYPANVPAIESLVEYLVARVRTDVAGAVFDIRQAVSATEVSVPSETKTKKAIGPVELPVSLLPLRPGFPPYELDISFFSVDEAGNVEAVRTQTFRG